MSESLSTLNEQILEKICQTVLGKNPRSENDQDDKDVIYFKGFCSGLIYNQYVQYYNSTNMKMPSIQEINQMLEIVKMRVNNFFDNKTHT